MMRDCKSLELTEAYEFNVTVESGALKYFGKLNLNPEKSVITIMGEILGDRECNIGFDDIDRLICYDLNNTFILHNLNCVYSSSRTLETFPHPIGFFEYKFEIDFIIFSPIRTNGIDCISSLSIHSKSIEQWVGYTDKQEKILRSYDDNQPAFANPDMVTEFTIDLKNKDALVLNYNWKMEGSYNKFHTGLTFYPSLLKAFHPPFLPKN